MQPEKLIENAILHWLYIKGYYAIKHQSLGIWDPVKKIYRKSNNRFHSIGIADIQVLIKGRPIFLEVKTKTGKQSESQKKFQRDMIKIGIEYYIVRSIDDVEKIFKGVSAI